MIRTKKKVLIDFTSVTKEIVYLQVLRKTDVEEQGLVQLDVEMFIKKDDKFLLIKRQKAVYKMATFDKIFEGTTRANYDAKFIETIGWLNEKRRNGGFTGNEIQQVSFWAEEELGGLTVDDFEIYTPEAA
jgi:hypothetical protein